MRPALPVIAATADVATYRRLALLWGVHPLLVPHTTVGEERIAALRAAAQGAGWVRAGQTVVLAVGATVGSPGGTNAFRVETL